MTKESFVMAGFTFNSIHYENTLAISLYMKLILSISSSIYLSEVNNRNIRSAYDIYTFFLLTIKNLNNRPKNL